MGTETLKLNQNGEYFLHAEIDIPPSRVSLWRRSAGTGITSHWFLFILFSLFPLVAGAETRLSVEVDGVSGEAYDNVMLLLGIERQKSHPELNEAWIKRLHAKAAHEIALALEPFGYYRVTVEPALRQEESGWVATYRVDPGPPLPITALDVTVTGAAAEDPEFRKRLDSPPLAIGDTFNHGIYEQWKNDLQRLADERGYFEAAFTRRRVRVDLENYGAEVALQMESGPRYRFGEVNLSGELLLERSLVRRYVTFSPGEPYSTDKLLRLQEDLYSSDYFARVNIKAEREAAVDHQVPITVQLEMNKRTRYRLGLGYGTDTGVRGSIGMERRYVNPKGHHIDAELQLSQIKDSLSADYIIPLQNPRTDRVVARTEYSRDRTEDIESSALSVGVGVEQVEALWHHSYFLNFQREKFDIGLQSGNARLLMPTLSWNRIDSNDVLNTVKGSRIGLELRGARVDAGSNTSVAQGHLSGKLIHSVNGGRFLLRGEVGTSWAPVFEELPPSVRFFAGGDTSVRGYSYKSLGPQDSAGNVIGGKHLLVTSAEYEHRLGEKWSAAIFFDAGNAFADYRGRLEQGAGIGVRRRLPIGWLRIDVAQGISDEDKPWRLHITLGPDL